MDAAYMTYREMKIIDNRIRRRRIVRRQRFILAAIIAVVIFAITFTVATMALQAHSDKGSYKYYSSIAVESGDTLEAIAGRYISDEYSDTAAYIREVSAINHLDENGTIYAGENIIVPYYDSEFH